MRLFETLLIDRFVVSRQTRTTDGQGGWAQSWEAVAEVSGRLRPLTASERLVAQQRQAQITHVLYTTTDSGIERGDLVTGAGKTVEVIAVREPSHMGRHYEIDCRETQTAAELEAS